MFGQPKETALDRQGPRCALGRLSASATTFGGSGRPEVHPGAGEVGRVATGAHRVRPAVRAGLLAPVTGGVRHTGRSTGTPPARARRAPARPAPARPPSP